MAPKQYEPGGGRSPELVRSTDRAEEVARHWLVTRESCERQTLQPPDVVNIMVQRKPRRLFLSYKNACWVKIKDIQEFLFKHANGRLNSRKTLQLETSQRDLRDQFRRMETAWDNMKVRVGGNVFDEVEEIIIATKGPVSKALLDLEEFLDSNGFQVPTKERPQSVKTCPQQQVGAARRILASTAPRRRPNAMDLIR
jgi:hypothetical protein